jgi:hypothetical protein
MSRVLQKSRKIRIVNIDCFTMKTAYDCLKSGCDYAEVYGGAIFICNKPRMELFGKKEVET